MSPVTPKIATMLFLAAFSRFFAPGQATPFRFEEIDEGGVFRYASTHTKNLTENGSHAFPRGCRNPGGHI